MDSIEIGVKSTLLDGALTLNAALFRSEYQNLQTSALTGVTFAVANAGAAVTQGLELDARYALTDSLTLGGALSFLDATYEDFDTAACTAVQIVESNVAGDVSCSQDLTGAPLQYAPDMAGNINIEWSTPLNDWLGFAARMDVNYSDSFFTAKDEDPFSEADAYTKLNLRVALVDSKGYWEVALIGKNLTDEQTSTYINDVPINVIGTSTEASESYFPRTDRFRTIAIQGTFKF